MEDFTLMPLRHNRWSLTDEETGITAVFTEHGWNNSQDAHIPSGVDFMTAAKVLREMGEWVLENYSDIAL